MFPVLLHPDLYKSLRSSGPAVRARVWKTLLRLRDGHWGGGTRVKRLKGIARPIYEARTDSGDRLIFTMVRSALADSPDRLASHLQMWDLVKHDDADRVARRNRSPEAEFLELETLEQFEIDQPPPHPGAAFSEIAAGAADTADGAGDWEHADPLLQFLLPPDGVLPEPEEGLPGGIRWFLLDPAVLAGEEEFQHLFDVGGEELELKLSREQYEILATPGPVLLAGSAGSGKTTVAAHRLAAAAGMSGPSGAAGSPSALYLSYSAALVEHARALVNDLLRSRGEDPRRNPPDFFTFGDLYRSLIPRELREHQARPMNEGLFREWFRKSGRSLDPALVWEELRSILKGSCLSLTKPMLDEAAYFELGRKRAPLFIKERPEIYRIAQRYQEWLAEEGRNDRIDLCRRALAESRHHKARRWDVVVCDEVQDLTELEVAFVLSLCAREDLSGLLLTGDTQQIVNPSGFRWAEVKRLASKAAHAKAAPPVARLRRNLRSVRPLVELANTLLLLRREVYGRTEEDDPEEAVIEGPVPIEVAGGEEEVLGAIAGFGPRCAVLTLDDEETERLRQRLGTSRVFHVREAKGLEFETVVLWRLLTPDRDLVDRFCRGDQRLEREPRFLRLLQHLYVATTRARRHLAVYEGTTRDPFWNQERFRGRIEPEVPESLLHLFHPTASPAEWEREGDYFRQRGRFRQAAECYRRAGSPEREMEALALAEEEVENWSGALELWSRLGEISRQAPLLERLGRLEEALFLYRRLGQEQEARICELRLLERRGAWAEAAEGWEKLGLLKEAAHGWERAGDGTRALVAGARAAEEQGDWTLAGFSWLELARHQEAARCFRLAGNLVQTALALALHHEALGDWSRAAAAFRCARQTEKAARCLARAREEAGRPERAARIWEGLGETERAVVLYAQAGEWESVARLEGVQPESRQRVMTRVRELMDAEAWEDAGRLARARMEALRSRLPDLPWFVFVEKERLVWQEFCSLQLLEKKCSALRAEMSAAWARAARLWAELGDTQRATQARYRWIETLRDPVRRARAWVAAGEPERAVRVLEAESSTGLSTSPGVVVAAWQAEREERWSDAASLWCSLGRPRDEARCLARETSKALPAPDAPTPGDEPRDEN
ncbi:MAG TPA: UvrD-helicase domain-containing protein [Thermoanaerobaculia bacterium]|jgi:tetratricopeptide (TPR) repeat protein|nr:UvrD-helicase domain-containing protein [Thermoanaerobaculia bacterium]